MISTKEDARDTVEEIRKSLNLQPEEGISMLELELPWDPLAETLESAVQMKKQLLRYKQNEQCEKRDVCVEVFSTVNLSFLKGWYICHALVFCRRRKNKGTCAQLCEFSSARFVR